MTIFKKKCTLKKSLILKIIQIILNAAALTAFGEGTDADKAFFTGKPYVEGLGHAFWMRNYRASLSKWQTADPMGYPDGWNQLAYCNNGVTSAVDLWGCEETKTDVFREYDVPIKEPEVTDKGMHYHTEGEYAGRKCHLYIVTTYEYHYVELMKYVKKRRWERIDGLENILNGAGFGLDISAGCAVLSGVGTLPAGGLALGGIVCHSLAEIVNTLNSWEWVPVGDPIKMQPEKRKVDSLEVHVLE